MAFAEGPAMHMSKSLLVLFSLSLIPACGVGEVNDTGGGGGGGGGGGDGEAVGLVGDVTEDLSLSGTIELTADARIAAGVVVTIEAGSEVTAAEGITVTVAGSLQVLGTTDSRVTIHPSSGPVAPTEPLVVSAWAGVVVESGGSARFANVDGSGVATLLYCQAGAVQCELEGVHFGSVGNFVVAEAPTSIVASSIETLGTISLRGTGSLSIVDSRIFNSQHDIVVTSGGDLSIDHSEIGGAAGSYEHCNLHIGSANSVSVTNSNITSAVYGLMIGGIDGAIFTGNNFTLNETQDVLEVGTVSAAVMTGNYWEGGAPVGLGAAYDVSNPVQTPIAGSGPRVAL